MLELPEFPRRPFTKPRACLQPGDPDWVYQALSHLRTLYGVQTSNAHGLLAELERLVEVKAWLVYPPENPYGSYDAMIRAALGCTLDEFFAEVDRRKACIKAKAAEPCAEPGGVREGAGYPEGRHNGSDEESSRSVDNQGNHGNAPPRGNGTDYLLRRLARDRPDLLALVQSGDLTPNKAATRAGIRKPQSVVAIALGACRRMSAQELYDFEERFNTLLQERR